MHRSQPALAAITGIALLLGSPGFFVVQAQTSNVGSIAVTAADPTGATIPAAQLRLRDLGTNDTRNATTQVDGGYTFPNLPFGFYELTVSKDGFESQVFQSVQV